jgi:hypothetical protein
MKIQFSDDLRCVTSSSCNCQLTQVQQQECFALELAVLAGRQEHQLQRVLRLQQLSSNTNTWAWH